MRTDPAGALRSKGAWDGSLAMLSEPCLRSRLTRARAAYPAGHGVSWRASWYGAPRDMGPLYVTALSPSAAGVRTGWSEARARGGRSGRDLTGDLTGGQLMACEA